MDFSALCLRIQKGQETIVWPIVSISKGAPDLKVYAWSEGTHFRTSFVQQTQIWDWLYNA